jgi:diamine N-acetyltransferase
MAVSSEFGGAVGRTAAVSLREVTLDNLRDVLRLTVAAHQEQFVASNAVSIAQAYFYRDSAWFRAIYADDTPVGFVMLHVEPDKCEYHVWRFMIDQRLQRHGFGARAMALIVEYVRALPGATRLSVSCVPGEGSPGPFYERLGFVYTGEVDDGERVMQRQLDAVFDQQP